MHNITLREAKEDDLPKIHMIESKVYPEPWTFNFFRIIYHMNTELFLVALDEEEVIGYTVGEIETTSKARRASAKVGHVLNIAVKVDYQGIGVGTMLLDELEKRFKESGAFFSYLEVRESNTNAQEIYRNRGYEYVRTAENYYGDEDGLIMTKRLTR